MSRVLFVTRRDLLGVKGGDTLRALYLLELLGDADNVDMIDILSVGKRRSINEFKNFGFSKKIQNLFYFDDFKFSSVFTILYSFLAKRSALTFACFERVDIDRFIARNQADYDRVVYHLGRGVNLDYVREKDVIDLTDAVSLNYESIRFGFREFFSSPVVAFKKLLLKSDTFRVRSTEVRILESGATVSFVSSRDRSYLLKYTKQSLDGSRILITPNRRKFLAELKRSDGEKRVSSSDFLFIGNLRSVQNQDAVNFFLDEILPLVNSKMSQTFKLTIAGSIPQGLEQIYRQRDDVLIYGAYNNLEELRRLNVIGVSPIRIGAGLQNKVIDYIDMSIDFVATSVSVGGLSKSGELCLNIADSRDAFCDELCDLVHRPSPIEVLVERKRSCEMDFGYSNESNMFND